ncbi:hypothetical protein LCGC14_0488470 [marine sediment metagenome]|uniref:Uncharacterized protein n=1 Tax=marine sediment metagenome TaxID=412755 RepID=A0A0F9S739_9ZZZZ
MAEEVEISRHAIRTWIETIATGEFHYRNILGLSGKLTPFDDTKIRKIIYEFCHEKEPICESVGRNDGYYRPIDNHALPLDWQSKELRRESGLMLPFDLRKYVFIYPDTTIVVGGSKSSGKSGFCYRTVAMNMFNMNTILLTNLEGGVGMLRDRFNAMDIEIPTPAPFKVIPVFDHYHDYIKEHKTLYVIDYIDAPEGADFYLIGAQIKKVDQKLQGLDSNAVIGLQKPTTRDIAFGGEGTLKAATLYLAMDSNKLKIVDAKVPADKKLHPKNMAFTFLYNDEGTKFENIERCYDNE